MSLGLRRLRGNYMETRSSWPRGPARILFLGSANGGKAGARPLGPLPPMTAGSLLSALTEGSPPSRGPDRPTGEKGRRTKASGKAASEARQHEGRRAAAGAHEQPRREPTGAPGATATHLRLPPAARWPPAPALGAPRSGCSRARRPRVRGRWPSRGGRGSARP